MSERVMLLIAADVDGVIVMEVNLMDPDVTEKRVQSRVSEDRSIENDNRVNIIKAPLMLNMHVSPSLTLSTFFVS